MRLDQLLGELSKLPGPLALLMYLDQMPAVHVPRIDVREWRRLIEYRRSLVAKRTRCKNQLRTWARRHGLTSPRYLWNKAGLAWLTDQVVDSDAPLQL